MERLRQQRHASSHTIASYRDTFRLLFEFAQETLHKTPSRFELSDLNSDLVSAFLNHIEKRRGNGARTRNVRFTAIRSFCKFASLHEPESCAQLQRILAIPYKRHIRREVNFLTHAEIEALLAVPDRTTWIGRRDHALLLLAVQTGLRLSELTSLKRTSVILGNSPHVRCIGKGRKERSTPLAKQTASVMKAWAKEEPRKNTEVLFPTFQGGILSSDAVQRVVRKHVNRLRESLPSLKHSKRLTITG